MIKERIQKQNNIIQLKIYQKISSLLHRDLIDFLENFERKELYGSEQNNLVILNKNDYIVITINKQYRFYFTILNSAVIPFFLIEKKENRLVEQIDNNSEYNKDLEFYMSTKLFDLLGDK